MNFVNSDQIKEGYICKPYEKDTESFDYQESHGWQLILIMDYCSDGYHHKKVIDCKDEIHANALAVKLGLFPI